MSALSKSAQRPLLLGALLSICACQEDQQKPISAPRERSQAVQASVGTVAAATASANTAAAPSHAPAALKPRRSLCAGQMREGKALPKKPISQAAVADARPLPENLSGESGSFTWVNFWAAWCAPCKEEIPRLVNWERELGKMGRRFRVAFISLDDDERQLRQFLESQSSLHSTYWLKEGKERDEWMKGALLDSDPELPIHLLLDPHGKVRCKIQGAVEDADFQDLSRLLSEKAGE
ncbi:MAG TPA: TlpA disulfide reductase family protein [Polyangiaceae bacterium]|nr:TlpA disulfide reductase family protein [Polyangiaceae bacterium]